MKELSLQIRKPEAGQFLQKIDWNKQEIVDTVSEITKQYEGLIYTEDQIQTAKKDRAELNAMKKAISDRRIEVKKAILSPYETFEKEVKEIVALIDKPIAMIDKQTTEYEDRVKEDKRKELENHFAENVGELAGTLAFEMIFNPKWLNKTYSMKSCKEDIDLEIRSTKNALKVMESMVDDKYKPYAKDYYFRNGRDMNLVLEEVERMKAADQRAEEERLAREEASRSVKAEPIMDAEAKDALSGSEDAQDAIENPCEGKEDEETGSQIAAEASEISEEPSESIAEQEKAAVEEHRPTDPFADADTDTKIYKSSFTIHGTKKEILSVKEFMLQNGIRFGKVER